MKVTKRYKTLTPQEIMDKFHSFLGEELKVFENQPYTREEVWYEATRKWLDYMEDNIVDKTDIQNIVERLDDLERNLCSIKSDSVLNRGFR